VVDAHLDAIYGAGMLDNASGSATILDIAEKIKNVTPRNKLRFVWLGGEELGLLGSQYYVNNLSGSEASRIFYDLDADVTATPNYTIGVLDPAAPDLFGRTVTARFPNKVYEPSLIARDQAVDYLDSIGARPTPGRRATRRLSGSRCTSAGTPYASFLMAAGYTLKEIVEYMGPREPRDGAALREAAAPAGGNRPRRTAQRLPRPPGGS